MQDEYIYYFNRKGDKLGIAEIALIRNRELTDAELDTLKAAIAKDGHEYAYMLTFKGLEQPDFASTVNI